MTALAIGVVSYAGSKFAVSQGPDGLAVRLQADLESRGVPTEVRVNTENLGNRYQVPVEPRTVQSSLTAQLTLDRRWAAFVGRKRGPRWWTGHSARWAHRGRQLITPPDPSMIRRLLDIEASHRHLMQWAVDQESDWLLLLEDDAFSPDVEDCASGLLGVMRHQGGQPSYANLSHSFSPAELGIQHLLTLSEESRWVGTRNRVIYSAERPVTNTVCAILYRTSFLTHLVDIMNNLPLEPVLPIDWKLNEALMVAHERGLTPPGSCWMVEPAPIIQMSMR